VSCRGGRRCHVGEGGGVMLGRKEVSCWGGRMDQIGLRCEVNIRKIPWNILIGLVLIALAPRVCGVQ